MSTSLQTRHAFAPSLFEPWASGRFALRVFGAGEAYARPVEIRRPYALVGRAPGADVVLDHHAVSPRHVYLHLDRRGLFAVDLATPVGSRIGPLEQSDGWLRPGEAIDVADFRIELAALHLDDPDLSGPGAADPLFDVAGDSRAHVTLYPEGGGAPLVLHSELIFAGRAEACGVRIDDDSVAPVQCVLVRAERGTYLVDLVGRGTGHNGQPLREHRPLHNGDVLALGTSRFECRVRSASEEVVRGQGSEVGDDGYLLSTQHSLLSTRYSALGIPHSALDTSDQESVLAWMLGALQANQSELLRRQAVFERNVLRALRRLQSQQAIGHSQQLERLEHLNHEVAQLRDEVRRRYASNAPLPRVEPLRALPSVSPLPSPSNTIDETDAWLARRIGQIHQENRAARREALKKC